MGSKLANDIEHEFSSHGRILDDKLVEKCVSIAEMYGISAEDMVYKVEAINYKASVTGSEISPITMETLRAVEKDIQRGLSQKANTTKAKTQMRGSFITAQVDRSRLPKHAQQLAAKAAPLQQIKQENPGETSSSSLSSSIVTTSVSFFGPSTDPEAKKKRAYRYMYEKMSERSESLDGIIDDFSDLIQAHYGLKTDSIGDPSVSTDEEIVIVGRITHDAETASMSKLAEGAMVIESSRAISGGARTSLRLDPTIKIRGAVKDVGGFGLYPGQMAAFKGRNGGGGYFLATEFLAIPPLKPSPAALGIINPKSDPTTSQTSATIFVACGPYTVDADLGYRPWKALLHQIKAQKPAALLLVGPFVDSTHPKMKAGDADASPSNIFKAQFIDPLKGFLNGSPESVVLMVPSVKDLISNHVAFPQPELDAGLFELHPRVHLLPNPARFTINDVSFATTSIDTLFHLRKEEYTKRGIEVEPLPATQDDLPNDTMANLCRHLLLQRSFYPIFPPPQDLASEVNLDMSHFDGVQMVDSDDLDYAPDVLLLPSRLKQFSKVIHSTTTINPSFISKGTYGVITIAPRSSGRPKDRVKAEVAKIEVVVKSEVPAAAISASLAPSTTITA